MTGPTFPSDDKLDAEIAEAWTRLNNRGSQHANTEPTVQATLLNVPSNRRVTLVIGEATDSIRTQGDAFKDAADPGGSDADPTDACDHLCNDHVAVARCHSSD